MEYQVPQFIEVEDKIFGPLTLRQFIYIAGGIGIAAMVFVTMPFLLALFITLPVGALTLALAFHKINGKPFIEIMEAAFNYYTNKRLYLWKKEVKRAQVEAPVVQSKVAALPQKSLSARKLHDLAWSLDIKDSNVAQQ
jgi:hypothetical protein